MWSSTNRAAGPPAPRRPRRGAWGSSGPDRTHPPTTDPAPDTTQPPPPSPATTRQTRPATTQDRHRRDSHTRPPRTGTPAARPPRRRTGPTRPRTSHATTAHDPRPDRTPDTAPTTTPATTTTHDRPPDRDTRPPSRRREPRPPAARTTRPPGPGRPDGRTTESRHKSAGTGHAARLRESRGSGRGFGSGFFRPRVLTRLARPDVLPGRPEPRVTAGADPTRRPPNPWPDSPARLTRRAAGPGHALAAHSGARPDGPAHSAEGAKEKRRRHQHRHRLPGFRKVLDRKIRVERACRRPAPRGLTPAKRRPEPMGMETTAPSRRYSATHQGRPK